MQMDRWLSKGLSEEMGKRCFRDWENKDISLSSPEMAMSSICMVSRPLRIPCSRKKNKDGSCSDWRKPSLI